MRASGSHSITFDGVRIEANRLQDAFPYGRADGAWLERYLTSGLAHASATLGIAEAAHATVTRSGPDRRSLRANDPRAVMVVADNAVELAAMRATLSTAADGIDGTASASSAARR
jgi:alkylation response protein AidB-like acyl-CoA dehydrogenase